MWCSVDHLATRSMRRAPRSPAFLADARGRAPSYLGSVAAAPRAVRPAGVVWLSRPVGVLAASSRAADLVAGKPQAAHLRVLLLQPAEVPEGLPQAAARGRRPAGYSVVRHAQREAAEVRPAQREAVEARPVQRAEAAAQREQPGAVAARYVLREAVVRVAAAAELPRAAGEAVRVVAAELPRAAGAAAVPVSPQPVSVGCLSALRLQRLSPPSPQG